MNEQLQIRVAETMHQLRQAAAERGLFITGDCRIGEAGAAELTGYALGSFKNLRAAGACPAYYCRPLSGSRVSYRLADLALWIERSREETL